MTDNAAIRTDHPARFARCVGGGRTFQASILADVGGRRGTLGGRIQPLAST